MYSQIKYFELLIFFFYITVAAEWDDGIWFKNEKLRKSQLWILIAKNFDFFP